MERIPKMVSPFFSWVVVVGSKGHMRAVTFFMQAITFLVWVLAVPM